MEQQSYNLMPGLLIPLYLQCFGDLLMGKNRKHGFSDWGKVTTYSNNTEKSAY